VILVDTVGAIYNGRIEHMNPIKIEISKISNLKMEKGLLKDVIKNSDVFIGVSVSNILTSVDVHNMNSKSIVFAMANPTPEIMPEEAIKGGAYIVATGRSDYPNQINNVLSFPGLMKGSLLVRAREVNTEMKIAAAEALASMIKKPVVNKIIPSPFDKDVAKIVANAVKLAAIRSKVNQI